MLQKSGLAEASADQNGLGYGCASDIWHPRPDSWSVRSALPRLDHCLLERIAMEVNATGSLPFQLRLLTVAHVSAGFSTIQHRRTSRHSWILAARRAEYDGDEDWDDGPVRSVLCRRTCKVGALGVFRALGRSWRKL